MSGVAELSSDVAAAPAIPNSFKFNVDPPGFMLPNHEFIFQINGGSRSGLRLTQWIVPSTQDHVLASQTLLFLEKIVMQLQTAHKMIFPS